MSSYSFSPVSNRGKDNEKKIQYTCIRCGHDMKELSVCHLKCFKCGAEYDCSDKGNYW